jgi:hypothetical protein
MDWHDVVAILSPIITLFILIIGGLVSYFTIIGDIKNRLTRLETQMQPFWSIIEKELPRLIHSPHTPEIDALLDKMAEGKLTIDDAKDLRCRLKAEMEIPDIGKKLAIVLIIARLDAIINGG